MRTPERSPERDAALDAMLPNVPFDGWTYRALRMGLAASGAEPEDAPLLFPGGARDMIEAFCDLADRRMEQQAACEYSIAEKPESQRDHASPHESDTPTKSAMTALRTPARVRRVIAIRLEQNRGNKEAMRRALAVLAMPANAPVAAACTARTVDTIWHAAGDQAADFSWYTKRVILTGVYTTTMLYWLRDASDNDEATLAFLDRRLHDVGRITALRRRFQSGPRFSFGIGHARG